MRRISALFIILSLLISCEIYVGEMPDDGQMENIVAPVCFSLEAAEETRSSISPDESKIYDLNIYAYRNGMLVDEVFASTSSEGVLHLPVGYAYNIYAVANMGYQASMSSEEELVESFAYAIGDVSMIEYGVPMFCVGRNVFVTKSTRNLTLQMKRLAAKIMLTVDKASLLDGLRVNSVRLCQSASVLRPFKWEKSGGSRVLAAGEATMGDQATDEDLMRLNSGETISFYTLENCQGVLLPNNKDPKMKVPDRLGKKQRLCTYLEAVCSFGPEGIFDGEVCYRIYLGLDSTSSFDVPGNSCINVSLMLTDEALQQVSWKVDADVSVREGYAYGCISKGMHSMDDLYVGEKVLYCVEFADELLEYLNGDIDGCELVFEKNGKVSEGIRVDDVKVESNSIYAELLCCLPVSTGLSLYSRHGECLGRLEGDVTVKHPEMICSEYPQWTEPDPVEFLTYMPVCEINGSPAQFYIYLVDDDGYALNGERTFGFDPSLFDFVVTDVAAGNSSVDGVSATFRPFSDDRVGQAVASVDLSCVNDGEDHAFNQQLSDIYNLSRPVRVRLGEENFGIAANVSVEISIPMICLTLVDNGWAKYHDCQLSVVVDNPSNLPLDVSVWQLVVSNRNFGAVDKAYVEQNLTIDRMKYITGAFYNDVPPLYGSRASFICERNSYGSNAVKKENLLVYPLVGISTDDIRQALYYDKLGNHQMMHSLDVSLNGMKIRDGDVILEDKVSDGSITYDYIYYDAEAWNYRGAGLFSCGEPVSYSGTWSYEYPYVCADALDGLYRRYKTGERAYLKFSYNPETEEINLANCSAVSSGDAVTLSISYEGCVNGYVKTYPTGTAFAGQDHYCSLDIGYVATDIPLRNDPSFASADNGKVKDVINGIYGFSYLDSSKPMGGDLYMHKAHPVDMTMNVDVLLDGESQKEIYPADFEWNISAIKYFHQQDNINYNCSLSVDNEMFTMVVIGHK